MCRGAVVVLRKALLVVAVRAHARKFACAGRSIREMRRNDEADDGTNIPGIKYLLVVNKPPTAVTTR